ncbi:methyl-accepting chemotaxis protein [Undibacterium sp.]|uniref:methyl-accepting chemotaxis protein n=1 Tax=Undibacterium sp. TaxID=1914977 RepID=UPI002B6F9F15|nr:methyl-accepting chemotaxis protein [Undibacterium sp.]HTD03705.1 methyl-accepting chemotaxis protein [Undibacterium sp.]
MTFLTNVRISTRLAIGFSILLALSVVSTSFSLINARSNAAATRQMMEKPLAKERLVADWYVLIYSAIARTSMIARSTDETLSATFSDVISASTKKGTETMKGIEALLSSDEEKALYKEIVELRVKYQGGKDLVMNARKGGDAATAERAYNETFVPASKNYQDKVMELLSMQRKSIDQTAAAIDQANDSSSRLTILLSVLLIAIGVIAAVIISRSITRPLKQAVHAATMVAAGDLTTSIDTSSRDEIGELMRALEAMNSALRNIVSQVKSGTYAIAGAAGEISTGNLDLSARTEQQASSLEETAASMEELTSTVKQNAENAGQANQLALTASDVAVRGGRVVSQVVDTMGSINESAKKIVDIIGVIDSIAFQTNILALNAAVEAARAGEQGRGFAVVASEVRSLAHRSAEAAKEIKLLIGDSVDKVGVGAKLVDEAGATMVEVVASVKRVTDIMGEITAATKEQSAGIEQVNLAISDMDNTTQQNAALVEQAAAAAQSMQDQAAALADVVDTFKLEQTGPASATAKPAPVRRVLTNKPVAVALR